MKDLKTVLETFNAKPKIAQQVCLPEWLTSIASHLDAILLGDQETLENKANGGITLRHHSGVEPLSKRFPVEI